MKLKEWVERQRRAGLTQAEVARSLGVSQATLSRLLGGKRSLSYVSARRVSRVTRIAFDDLPLGVRTR